MNTLLSPRVVAARRQWRRGGAGRPLVIAGVAALFLTAGYKISARVLEHFAVRSMVDQTVEVYRRALGAARTR